jgi:hypothetical protein
MDSLVYYLLCMNNGLTALTIKPKQNLNKAVLYDQGIEVENLPEKDSFVQSDVLLVVHEELNGSAVMTLG